MVPTSLSTSFREDRPPTGRLPSLYAPTFIILVLTCMLVLSRQLQFIQSSHIDSIATTTYNNDNIPSCFRAREHNISASYYGNMPKPFINLGMPKMGSTSLQSFFKCGHYNSSHYECGKEFCADCMKRAVANGNPPLSSCGENYDAFVQLDDGSMFPQIEYLNEIHREKPNSTLLLTFRPMADWYKSITHWPPNADKINKPLLMSNRMTRANITNFPSGKGTNEAEFSNWFCGHVERVREFVALHPSHALVEVDIMNNNVGVILGEVFGIESSCWGHSNKNPVMESDQ